MPPSPLAPSRGGPVGALTRDDVLGASAYIERLQALRGDAAEYLALEHADDVAACGGSFAQSEADAAAVAAHDLLGVEDNCAEFAPAHRGDAAVHKIPRGVTLPTMTRKEGAAAGAGAAPALEAAGHGGRTAHPGLRDPATGEVFKAGRRAVAARFDSLRRMLASGRKGRQRAADPDSDGSRSIGEDDIRRMRSMEPGVAGGGGGGRSHQPRPRNTSTHASFQMRAFSSRSGSATSTAATNADAIVAAIASRMNDDDAPFVRSRQPGDRDAASRTDARSSHELRTRRAAHRLLLGVLSFDGASGLVAARGVSTAPESGDVAEGDRALDTWYRADADLATAVKEYRRHAKALEMLHVVCRGLQDATRAVERAAAALHKDGGVGGMTKPSRFWTDAREKAAQVTVLIGRLVRYDVRLPIVAQIRGTSSASDASVGALKRATKRLHAPLPAGDPARDVVEAVRSALVDAREVGLESMESCSEVTRESAKVVVDLRHAKLTADALLIEERQVMVDHAVATVETDPASLRVLFEVAEVVKAQLAEAKIGR